MATKLTRELEPDDEVMVDGVKRTIRRVRRAMESYKHGEVWDVEYVPLPDPSHGAWAAPDEVWQMAGPSKLDEAVARAQALADQYANGGFITGRDVSDLFDLFLDAR